MIWSPNKTLRHPCEACLVRNRALCRALSPAGLTELNRISSRRRFPAGATILHEGEPADWCAIILSGVAKLVKATSDGREQIVAVQFTSDFVGQPFTPAMRLRAEAATSVELCCFSRGPFEALLAQHPGLSRALIEEATGALDAAREWMLVLGRKSAGERVASFILHMAERSAGESCGACTGPVTHGAVFELPLSRTEMGQFLGLRIETVSRQLNALRTAGAIQTIGSRKVRIVDAQELKNMSECDPAST